MKQRGTDKNNAGNEEESLISIWDKVSNSYDEARYWSVPEPHAWLATLLSHVGDASGKKIIEIGCGSGFMSVALAKKGAIPSILDISDAVIKKALVCFEKNGLDEPEYFIQNILNNNIPPDRYDVVWNAGVIEHFQDQEKEIMVREMFRIAKPGGKIVIMVPNSLCWQARLGQLWQEWRKTWPYGFQDNMSPNRLRNLCKRIGLIYCDTYAFDPVVGWVWVPMIGALLKRWLGSQKVEAHVRKSWRGYLSVLVISKV